MPFLMEVDIFAPQGLPIDRYKVLEGLKRPLYSLHLPNNSKIDLDHFFERRTSDGIPYANR